MKAIFVSALAILLLGGAGDGRAQTSQKAEKKQLSPQEIIQAFAAKESEFLEAWKQYAYRQIATVKVTEKNGVKIDNESMVLIWEIVFHDDGTRELKLTDRGGRLRSVGWTPEDEEVISNIQPFALTTKDLPLYNLKYEGKEKVDELVTYVFSVKPKKIESGRMYFQGKIWVDDVDLQIVRTMGKAVPQKRENQFPEFETLRQMVDNQYWFPAWTHADSMLDFGNERVRVEETVTYDNYRRFGSKASIKYGPPQ